MTINSYRRIARKPNNGGSQHQQQNLVQPTLTHESLRCWRLSSYTGWSQMLATRIWRLSWRPTLGGDHWGRGPLASDHRSISLEHHRPMAWSASSSPSSPVSSSPATKFKDMGTHLILRAGWSNLPPSYLGSLSASTSWKCESSV